MIPLTMIHHYSYDYGNGGVCYIRDTITVEVNGEMLVDSSSSSPITFSSVPEVYKFLLKKANIDIDERHVIR